MMKFGTFSVVVGNDACNARCDFCVAKMTEQINFTCQDIDLRRFSVACRLAEKAGVTTALLTSKGEPTLFPIPIQLCLEVLKSKFPLIELQTNGLVFLQDKEKWSNILETWVDKGLTTIALSIVHYENYMNEKIYCDSSGNFRFKYPDLTETIDFLVGLGLSVRLNCIGIKKFIDTPEEIQNLLAFAKGTGHELQVTWRPVQMPDKSRNDIIAEQTRGLEISESDINRIRMWPIADNHPALYNLPHGATIYDIDGQNLCLANCLTIQPDLDEIRQIIYVDGHIRYDWQHRGAIIL